MLSRFSEVGTHSSHQHPRHHCFPCCQFLHQIPSLVVLKQKRCTSAHLNLCFSARREKPPNHAPLLLIVAMSSMGLATGLPVVVKGLYMWNLMGKTCLKSCH